MHIHIHAHVPGPNHLTNHFYSSTSYSQPHSVADSTCVGPSIFWAYPYQCQDWGDHLMDSDTISKPHVCEIWPSWVVCWAVQGYVHPSANGTNGTGCNSNIGRITDQAWKQQQQQQNLMAQYVASRGGMQTVCHGTGMCCAGSMNPINVDTFECPHEWFILFH